MTDDVSRLLRARQYDVCRVARVEKYRVRWCVTVIVIAGCGGSTTSAPDATFDPVVDASRDAVGECGCCNVNLQTGCATGDQCGWIRVDTEPTPLGIIGCAPSGTVATGGACTWGASGETTGYDNCAIDNFCAADATTEEATGICTPFCSLTGSDRPCPTGFTCTEFPNVFANTGDTPVTGLCVATN